MTIAVRRAGENPASRSAALATLAQLLGEGPAARPLERREAHGAASSIMLTCAATTRQPSAKRTQVCI